jgi:hypothetical protein
MFELASGPRDLGEILAQGIRLGQLAFRRLFMLTSIMEFLALVPTAYFVWGVGDTPMTLLDVFKRMLEGDVGLVSLCTLLVLFPIRAIVLMRVASAARGQTFGLREEARKALHLWPALLAAGVVYVIAVFLGIVLLVIPGVILAVSLKFEEFALVLDGKGPIQALNTSHDLVWRHWWRTLGLLLVMFVPIWMFMSVVGGLIGIDAGNSEEMTVTGRSMFEQGVLSMVFYAVLWPFLYSILYVYFHDLKLRKQTG